MRSVLRWLRWLVLGMVLLVIVVIGGALIAAHTGWGREWLRANVEAALQRAFPGGAHVGAIEGSVLDTLTVRDLELDGRDHRPLVTVDTLQVAVALWPLLVQTAEIDELAADGVHVFVHREPPPPPAKPEPAPGGSPFHIELPQIELHHATVEIEAGDTTQNLTDLDVTGIATIDAAGVTLFGCAHGAWREGGAELTAAAAVVLDGGVRVPGAFIALGGDPRATLNAADLAIDGEQPSGTVAVNAPARGLAKLVPELDRAGVTADHIGDVVATIDVAATTPNTTWIELHAVAGQTTFEASLHGDLAAGTAQGTIRARALDLGLVTDGRVAGRGDVVAIGAGHRVDGKIFLDDPRIVATSPAVELSEWRASGQLAVDARAHGTLAPALQLTVAGEAAGDTVAVEEPAVASARPAVEIGSVRVPFDLSIAPARGDIGSPAFDVAVTGKVAGKAVAINDLAIATVNGSFAARVAGGASHGEAHLTGAGIRNAGTPVGAAHVDVATGSDDTLGVAVTAWPPAGGLTIFTSARVALRLSPTFATLRRTAVTLPNGMIWEGQGGAVAVTDAAVTLRDVTLHHDDATVALRGAFARSTGALTAHLDADRFLASAIDPGYRGLASGTLDLAHRAGGWQADGTFTVTGFAGAADVAPFDGTAHLVLAGRRATLDASAASAELGRIELAFEAVAPRDPFDLGAWRTLDRGEVRNATITARDLRLSGVAALAGPARLAGLTGTIDGTINLAPAALDGRLAVRGVELPFGVIDGDLMLAPHDGDLSATATTRLFGIAAADLTARLAVPERPFDPATWQRRGRDLLKGAAADLDEVAFDPALLARLGVADLLARRGIPALYRGHATVQLAVGAEVKDARLAMDVNNVTGGALVESVSSHMAISVGAQGTHLRTELTGHDVEHAHGHDFALGVLDADLPMTIDRWIDEPASVLRAPVTAQWTLPVTPVRSILAAFGRHDLDGGTLEGSATIRGTLGTPILEPARLLARELSLPLRLGGAPLPALRDLEVVATWGGASGTVTVTGHEAGGELRAFASGRPDALAGVTGWLAARQLNIAPLAVVLSRPLVPTAGLVTADLALRPGGQVTGRLEIAHGALPIAAAVGTLRDVTANVELSDRTIAGTIAGNLGHGTVRLSAAADTDLTAIELRELQLKNVSLLGAWRPILTATLKTAEHKPLLRRDGVLRGSVTVQGASITLPEHAGASLLATSAPSDLEIRGTTEPATAPGPRAPAHPWLEVDVALDPTPLEARNVMDSVGLGVKATLSSSKLRVAVGDTIGVKGDVAIENANVDVLGRRYDVDPTSSLEFGGTIDPRLDIAMTHQFPELALNVTIRGTASTPELDVTGTPTGYTKDQLFGFLIGGEPGGDPSTQTGEAVKNAVVLGVSGKLGRQIANKVLPIKVDALSCEPATTATSASCTVGKWLSHQLFLSYRQHLEPRADENANDVQVQYRLGPKVLIEGGGGDRGHSGADLLWRHRW